VQPLCQNAPLRTFLSLHFTKQVATFFGGIFGIPFFVFKRLLFFPHSDQRKEAKERRFINFGLRLKRLKAPFKIH